MSPLTTVFATVTGVYGGYFGAGAGVMMVAVLGLGTDLELRVVNGLKTLSLMVGNIVAGLIFVVVADPRWDAAAVLALPQHTTEPVLDPSTGAYTRFDPDAGQWLVFDEERRQWRPAAVEPELVALPASAPRRPTR